ncbi:hypothetical protein H0H81_002220 [Sphagnurus paluster]|uniref:Uncharacterized protein n=1 Tax=Sphagnurus paluster TaxID=117069 RepID=A0A9P7FTF0_9AGAR|nr:hypothetical protein H0H81_002220 [Sphagnurus paluster]
METEGETSEDEDEEKPETKTKFKLEEGAVVTLYENILNRYPQLWCHFCTGPLLKAHTHMCTSCGALICEGTSTGMGCIANGSVVGPITCRNCLVRTRSTMQGIAGYRLNGTGIRTCAKIAWPLLLIPIKLANHDSTPLEFASYSSHAEYGLTNQEILIYEIQLTGWRAGLGPKHMVPTSIDFLERARASLQPANMIVILDTRSTGQLQTLGEYENSVGIVRNCIGEKIMDKMVEASVVARGWEETVCLAGGTQPWADMTPKTRGGWRVLVLLACGSATTVDDSWSDIKNIISSNELDLVVGFSGKETMPLHVDGFIRRLVQLINTAGMVDIWDTVKEAVVDSQGALKMHNILVAFRTPAGIFRAYEIGLHSPSSPFGMRLSLCGGLNCPQRAECATIYGKTKRHRHGHTARILCFACSWRSRWVRIEMLKELVYPLHKQVPDVFFHEYPMSPQITSVFLTPAPNSQDMNKGASL